jgi:hypothetical protein
VDAKHKTVSSIADGSRVAISAPNANQDLDRLGSQSIIFDGSVSVFRFIEGLWNQIGTTIDSKHFFESFGQSVAISFDGTRIAVTIFLPFGGRGHVRIFDWLVAIGVMFMK